LICYDFTDNNGWRIMMYFEIVILAGATATFSKGAIIPAENPNSDYKSSIFKISKEFY